MLTSYDSFMQVGTGKFDFFHDYCTHPAKSLPSGSSSNLQRPPALLPAIPVQSEAVVTPQGLPIIYWFLEQVLSIRLLCINLL